ncbi:MAG: tetratricopeptide repeat protein [Planctomycetia bacterium]|nr:tetratricopeptide repeat protein [Planctomycetia bacterium]
MRLPIALAILGCCLAGCASPDDQRVRDYNADGVHLFAQGAYPEAQQTFQAALALQPNDPGLLYNLGECYHRQGGLQQAEGYYNDCLKHDPQHVPCRFARAALLVQMGRRAEAERSIQDWLQAEPKNANAYALDGWFQHQAGDLPRAQARLQQALEMDPHNQRALIEMGLLYEAMQRPERALVLYERVTTDAPNQPEVARRVKELKVQGVSRPKPD